MRNIITTYCDFCKALQFNYVLVVSSWLLLAKYYTSTLNFTFKIIIFLHRIEFMNNFYVVVLFIVLS